MPQALTEDATNADLDTGLQVPSNGDDSEDWAPTLIAGSQQLADREQALAQLGGVVMSGGLATRKVVVPVGEGNQLRSSITSFAYVFSSGAHYWQQTSVAAAGAITFEVPPLPIGATITGAYCFVANDSNTTLPVGTMPTLRLLKNVYTVGAAADPGGYDATVASQADTTALSATYKLMHKIAITGLSEVVAADVVYRITLEGETGSNSTTGLNLATMVIELGVS
jgi:hypothetical protein